MSNADYQIYQTYLTGGSTCLSRRDYDVGGLHFLSDETLIACYALADPGGHAPQRPTKFFVLQFKNRF